MPAMAHDPRIDAYIAARAEFARPILEWLRARVHADLTARMTSTARLRAYTPREVTPGLALAYDLYEDVSRETELIERNAILHPGFLPARPLKVLSA